MKESLIVLSDYVIARTRARLAGLTDEEYAWTPVEDCWTAGSDGAGGFHADWTVPPPEPAPFTTLAWRLYHLMDCYSADRNARWLGIEPSGNPLADTGARPVNASSALALLDRCIETWQGYLAAATEEALVAPLGPIAGQYATSSGADLVLHQIDEHIHHSAEIALLRDLYAATVSNPADPILSALMKGDRSAVDAIDLDDLKRRRPRLVTEAAARGRWDGVRLLVERGFEVDNPGGRSALHQAAGSGRGEIVTFLLDHGADATGKDPQFLSTPDGWADYFGHTRIAGEIRDRTKTSPAG